MIEFVGANQWNTIDNFFAAIQLYSPTGWSILPDQNLNLTYFGQTINRTMKKLKHINSGWTLCFLKFYIFDTEVSIITLSDNDNYTENISNLPLFPFDIQIPISNIYYSTIKRIYHYNDAIILVDTFPTGAISRDNNLRSNFPTILYFANINAADGNWAILFNDLTFSWLGYDGRNILVGNKNTNPATYYHNCRNTDGFYPLFSEKIQNVYHQVSIGRESFENDIIVSDVRVKIKSINKTFTLPYIKFFQSSTPLDNGVIIDIGGVKYHIYRSKYNNNAYFAIQI